MQKFKTTDRPVIFDKSRNLVHFDSVRHVGQWCKEAQPQHRFPTEGRAWTNYLSWDRAIAKAMHGDDAAVVDATRIMDKFGESIPSQQWLDVPSVVGAYPVVPEALNNEPECMRMPELHSVEGAPLRIIVDLICQSTVDAEQMMQRGCAILALVMRLVAERPVTLQFCVTGVADPDNATSKNDFSMMLIDVETAPLELATTAYALSNVGFARHLGLGVINACLGFSHHFAKLEGLRSFTPGFKDALARHLGIVEEFLYIPPVTSTDMLVTHPQVWVVDQYKKFSNVMNELA